jgi:hypothetical protein
LEEGKAIYLDFAKAMDEGIAPGSATLSPILARWKANLENFWSPKPEQFTFLARMYAQDSRFRNNFDAIRPGLAEYIGKAVEKRAVFASPEFNS